jgi:hypothetical protein
MKKILLAAALALATTCAYADDTCKTKAVSKDNKPLAGAALKSFMTKCTKDATAACTKDATDQCKTKAVGSDNKPLAGAALKSFMTKCTKDAKPTTDKCVTDKTG